MEWKEAVNSNNNNDEWKHLWIGHPWLLYKPDAEKLIIRETTEYESIRELRCFTVDRSELKTAIDLAEKELKKFSATLERVISKIYSIEFTKKIVKVLVYGEDE